MMKTSNKENKEIKQSSQLLDHHTLQKGPIQAVKIKEYFSQAQTLYFHLCLLLYYMISPFRKYSHKLLFLGKSKRQEEMMGNLIALRTMSFSGPGSLSRKQVGNIKPKLNISIILGARTYHSQK